MSDDYPDQLKIKKLQPSRRGWNLIGAGCGFPIVAFLLFSVFYATRNRVPDINIPTHGVPTNNAYDDFARAGRLAKAMKHRSIYSTVSASAMATNPAYMALSARDAAPALAVLHNALDKHYITPPIRTAFGSHFPDLTNIRELARTASGTAKYYVQIGQTRRAVDTLLDGYEMGVSLPRGGDLMNGSVALAVQAICAKPLDPLLARLSPADLAHVARRLDKIVKKQVPYSDVVTEEGNAGTAILVAMLRSPESRGLSGYRALSAEVNYGKPSRVRDLLQGAKYALSDKNEMLHQNQKYYQAIAAEASQPYTGPFQTPVPNNIFAQTLMPEFDTDRAKFVAGEAVITLLRLETALYRYRAATGHFPVDLATLTSKKDADGFAYLPVIPNDPFGGQPLHYSLLRSGNGFLLYSIGDNLKDDRGAPQRAPGDRKGGDIVAGRMWLPRAQLGVKAPAAVGQGQKAAKSHASP